MDETIQPTDSNETLTQPVEIKFGSIIRYEGETEDDLSVVVYTHGPKALESAHIISNEEGKEKVGLPGTHGEKAEVLGFWPLDKMRRVLLSSLHGYSESTAPKDVLDKLDSRISENSSRPPVMYTGSGTL